MHFHVNIINSEKYYHIVSCPADVDSVIQTYDSLYFEIIIYYVASSVPAHLMNK